LGVGKTQAKVYRSIEEVPDTLEPGKYIIENIEVIIHKPVEREGIVHQIRKTRELLEKYGGTGWV
jgi:hypothetical protein